MQYAHREYVKADYVEARYKSSGKRKQKGYIEYGLAGNILVNEFIKVEQA